MKGLMMPYQLTLPFILRRAESMYGDKEIITRLPDKTIHRYTYSDFAIRTKKLAAALDELGVKPGDRIATLCWNHYQHLEAYFAIPCIGAIIHPLNIRFGPNELSYIISHAEDNVIIIDEQLLPLYESIQSGINPKKVIVIQQSNNPLPGGYINYEELVSHGDEKLYSPFEGDENTAAFMCYTSGTTGKSKGVLYSHRSIVLHVLSILLASTGINITEKDIVLPVVPMFHACAWGFPYCCTLVGATQVFPGPYLDAENLLELFENEKVTLTGGVPTVMMNLLHHLDNYPSKYQLHLRSIILGGSALPRFLVKSFAEKYGISLLNTWGMTELSPLGTTSIITSKMSAEPIENIYDQKIKQGYPVPFVEIRGRNEQGFIPWDGVTMGELEVRGPCVASAYYKEEKSVEKFTADGWLKTGDIVSIDKDGCIEIKDRSKDLIKSGGEWISSVALELALMEHPEILEAAVIAIPHEKWIERPFAYVVTKNTSAISADELKEFLGRKFAKFWIPEQFAFIDEIPKSSVGKFLKIALREKYNRDQLHSTNN
jgi:fatty-acyl-CoA synthase